MQKEQEKEQEKEQKEDQCFLIRHNECGTRFIAEIETIDSHTLPPSDDSDDTVILISGPCPKCRKMITLPRSSVGEPLSKEKLEQLENLKVKWDWLLT